MAKVRAAGGVYRSVPGTDVPESFADMMVMAKALSKARRGMPEALQGQPYEVLSVMLRARALNIPIAVAIDYLYFGDDNRSVVMAKLARTLARRAGHRFAFPVHDRTRVVMLLQLRGESRPRRLEYTIADAQAAGLLDPVRDKDGYWTRFPEDMLVARVSVRAINRFCPEVVMGLSDQHLFDDSLDGGFFSDVVSPYRKRDVKAVARVLRRLAELRSLGDPSVRLDALRHLWQGNLPVLDFAVDAEGSASVRHVLFDAMEEAFEEARVVAGVADGGRVGAAPVTGSSSGGKGEKRGKGPVTKDEKKAVRKAGRQADRTAGRKASKETGRKVVVEGIHCGRTPDQVLTEGHTCGPECEA